MDDLVRIYLIQMTEFPRLSHKEEVAAARHIERTRTRFRYAMLQSDYLLRRRCTCWKRSATADRDWNAP